MMTTELAPCRAGFDGCATMREEAVRRHPRTPTARECRHLPIPPERPERLQGPEVGAVMRYHKAGGTYRADEAVRVLERSYVWAPGDPAYGGGSRRYDWKVVEFLGRGAHAGGGNARLVVDDADLHPIQHGDRILVVREEAPV